MKNVTVYDPAMCCSTGICGAEVDQNLVNFAANLDWLKSEGINVRRINLSQEPAEFASNQLVSGVLQSDGVDGLPVILIGEKIHASGRYPERAELAEMAGLAFASNQDEPNKSTGCCTGNDSEEKPSSGCC